MKPTSAETTILHLVISTAIAAIIGVISASVQFYYQHNFDIVQTAYFFVPALLASFGAMRLAVWHAVQSSPVLPQAERDAIGQAQQLAQTALGKVDHLAANVLPFVHQHPAPQQPPAAPIVSRAVTTPAARQPQPISFPAPGSVPATSATAHFGDTGLVPAVTPQ